MRFRSPLVDQFAGLALASAVHVWMRTLDMKVAYYDPTVDPVHRDYRGPKLFLFWHEYILFPLSVRGHSNLAMLLSRHGDAEVLSHAARFLGFEFVRGSTTRGGTSALREMMRRSRSANLTITPDGPRGPRRRLASGAIYLASRLDMPLVLLGMGYNRPWRAGSWDRFAIPRPFARARAVISPEIRVPAGLDRDGVEHHRDRVERLLNRLTVEAEAWAESGSTKRDEVLVRPAHGSRGALRIDPTAGPSGPHRHRGAS